MSYRVHGLFVSEYFRVLVHTLACVMVIIFREYRRTASSAPAIVHVGRLSPSSALHFWTGMPKSSSSFIFYQGKGRRRATHDSAPLWQFSVKLTLEALRLCFPGLE